MEFVKLLEVSVFMNHKTASYELLPMVLLEPWSEVAPSKVRIHGRITGRNQVSTPNLTCSTYYGN